MDDIHGFTESISHQTNLINFISPAPNSFGSEKEEWCTASLDFYQRFFFDNVFDSFIWLLWPINQTPLLVKDFPPSIILLSCFCTVGFFSQLFLVFFSVCFSWWYTAQLARTFCLPFRSPLQAWLRTVLLPLQQGKAARWAHPHQDLQSSISGWFQFKLRRALPHNRQQEHSGFYQLLSALFLMHQSFHSTYQDSWI